MADCEGKGFWLIVSISWMQRHSLHLEVRRKPRDGTSKDLDLGCESPGPQSKLTTKLKVEHDPYRDHLADHGNTGNPLFL